jgi:hypothetical protein
MSGEKKYNIDSGTSRERLQNEQADKLLQIPTIWNSTDFFMVAGRIVGVMAGSNQLINMIRLAALSNPAIAIWGLLVYLAFAGGVICWVIWNYKSKFHTAAWGMAIGIGIVFALDLHKLFLLGAGS